MATIPLFVRDNKDVDEQTIKSEIRIALLESVESLVNVDFIDVDLKRAKIVVDDPGVDT